MIDLQKVNKLYHGKSVVKDVQLTIPEKKLTAFIGPKWGRKINRVVDDQSFDTKRYR
jgi:iron complex transport system ATP-binding protein